jgi:fumarate reductase flavoprotein subunit
MVQLLHQRVSDCGIDVMVQAKLTNILTDHDGKACGIEIGRPDGAIERIGCDTLILASGGFAANRNMVSRYMPEMVTARNNGHEGSQGDAIRLCAPLGAALGDMGSYQGYAMLTEPHGISAPPGIVLEGGVIVNSHGQRFVDETQDIAGMVHPLMAQPGDHCWVVYDSAIEQRCGYIPETQALMQINAARTGNSPAELAHSIGVYATALEATLNDACNAAAAGHEDAQGRLWGTDRPPMESLRALKVVGAIYHTQGGLQIDGDARVQRIDRTALPNIFAAGGAARGVSGPSYWGYLPAMGLCAAVTLGRAAGQAAARQALALSS